MRSIRHSLWIGFALTLIAALTACSDENVKPTETTTSSSGSVSALYEAHEEGRIHLFYDRDLFQSFLKVGETPFRYTQIGAGPNGETLVYGLTNADKNKGLATPAAQLMGGEAAASSDFYGEMRKHGRIYVFSSPDDMATVRQFGHPNFFSNQIGAGPNGETVVYVMNNTNKNEKPVALMRKYKAMN